ncbi:MAG: hypothetical protein H6591_03610 [Flavobacteriales bacterium]|nr:hypothetical protein [Flavobacteriales bacterium]
MISRGAFYSILTLLLLISGLITRAQLYPYAGQFMQGTVLMLDSSRLEGEVKWEPHQNRKLRFRTSAAAEAVTYSPQDILAFTVDSFYFVPLFDIRVWAENAALLGRTSAIKQVFAQRLHVGTFTVYMVFIEAYDGVSGAIQTYPNLLFQRTGVPGSTPVPFPYAVRMKDKRFEKVKEPLITLFKDHPAVTEHLRNLNKQDDIAALLETVKAIDIP